MSLQMRENQLMRVSTSVLLEIPSSCDQSCTTVASRGVREGNRVITFLPSSLKFADMNFFHLASAKSRAAKTWSTTNGCCPNTEFSCGRNKVQGESSIYLHDIFPLQNHSSKRIDNGYPLDVQFQFWMNEEQINHADYCDGDEKSDVGSCSTFISDSKITQKESPEYSGSRQNDGVLWSERDFLHLTILSQQQLLKDGFAS